MPLATSCSLATKASTSPMMSETDNYGFRFAQESGVAMIETSHELSENAGLARLVDLLREVHPDIRFHYFENECVWQTV